MASRRTPAASLVFAGLLACCCGAARADWPPADMLAIRPLVDGSGPRHLSVAAGGATVYLVASNLTCPWGGKPDGQDHQGPGRVGAAPREDRRLPGRGDKEPAAGNRPPGRGHRRLGPDGGATKRGDRGSAGRVPPASGVAGHRTARARGDAEGKSPGGTVHATCARAVEVRGHLRATPAIGDCLS